MCVAGASPRGSYDTHVNCSAMVSACSTSARHVLDLKDCDVPAPKRLRAAWPSSSSVVGAPSSLPEEHAHREGQLEDECLCHTSWISRLRRECKIMMKERGSQLQRFRVHTACSGTGAPVIGLAVTRSAKCGHKFQVMEISHSLCGWICCGEVPRKSFMAIFKDSPVFRGRGCFSLQFKK